MYREEICKEICAMNHQKHEVVVYFANWNLPKKAAELGGEVASIPWDKVTYVNHAFWFVEPADGSSNTSFQQRDQGLGARNDFRIVSLHPDFDCGGQGESALVPGLPRNHFAQYAHFAKLHPEVKIMISLGGWSRCGYFSEMAYTRQGRASCIAACVALIRENPWIGGIDIDWEYPAGTVSGDRTPGDEDDQGCPIFGTAQEDRDNFTALLREMRAGLDEAFGVGVKKLTACSSGAVESCLPCQDWAAAAPSLDLINMMTYDLAGVWDRIANHASSARFGREDAAYFRGLGIPGEKLCVGSPLYASPYLLDEMSDTVIGAPCAPYKPNTFEIAQIQLEQFEREAVSGYEIQEIAGRYVIGQRFHKGGHGWHFDYDLVHGAPYMFNDDPGSPYYKWFISYENALSLQEKLDDIKHDSLGGIIVWEQSQDNAAHDRIGQMYDTLIE